MASLGAAFVHGTPINTPYITALYELPGSAYNSPDVQSLLIGFQAWDSSEVFTAQVVTALLVIVQL